ncbi:efflux RND transporter periplasmic adaptor subunit [Stieleria sp. ICT_E10.1]|uniref:efflux RND transporter periplasmic adaptor subunit n=1 Tax=Stieleria sedimenti TaxID=2976331 RepID=UPI00218006EE|nr:efflux RND transporter periplasmic adaptor subunit [Stieleria sedimenti]MCS7465108.1 efflux RND transporter periplasmic adaptor subunit [Stieleria sedimenti]
MTQHRFYAVGLLMVGCGLLSGCSGASNDYVPPPPPTVTTAKPIQQSLTLFLEQNGQTEPVEAAEVRSRVSGFVQEILFEPGQRVQTGDELYKIEPDTYRAIQKSAAAAVEAAKAAVAVAEAAQATAEAEVKNVTSQYDREKRLFDSNAGSQSALDAAEAARDSALAQRQAAAANVEAEKAKQLQADAELAQAELDLEYTTVRAPIEGRVTKTEVKLGNLVQVGTPLATVVDQREIFANFSLSDQQLLELMDNMPIDQDRRNTPQEWSKIAVYLQRDTTKKEFLTGRLNYVDQEGIEQSTGTFSLRAVFDNADRQLLPGMFVMIRLPIQTIESALLIPERAVARSPMGQFVLVVGEDNRVERREVVLGQRLDGWVLVEEGLDRGESFVLEGLQRARPGSEVAPTEIELSTEGSPILQASLTASGSTTDESPNE